MFKSLLSGLVLTCTLLVSDLHAFTPSATEDMDFQPNLGQMDERVAFWAQRDGIELFVSSKGELIHRLHGTEDQDWVLVERMAGSNVLQPLAAQSGHTQITMLGKQGTRSAFTTNLIDLGEAWNGIRVDLQLLDDQFEKRFHLDAGADVSAISVDLDGVEDVRISADGRLVLATGLGDVELSAPVAWQEKGAQRTPVAVQYTITSDASYGFALGEFDPEYGVTIDPVIRSTFVGGTGGDGLGHVEVTADSVYVSGYTGDVNFPGTSGGYQPNMVRNTVLGGNIYVARYNLELTTLVQATFFGTYGPFGSGGQSGAAELHSMVVTADSIYLAGTAPGPGLQIPATNGALQTSANGSPQDGFVARFSLDLTQLLAATYFGGTKETTVWPMVVTDTAVFIGGYSGSTNLPGLINGANNTPPSPAGTGAAYVAKLSLDLSTAIATSWVSAGGWDMNPRAMTLGADGSVYIAGYGSRGLFETAGAFQPNRSATNFTSDGFIVRLNSSLSTIHRSTYLGSTGADRIESMDFSNNKLYAAGRAAGANFPVPVGGAVTTWGSESAFAMELAADLSSIDGGSFYRGNIYSSVAKVLAHDEKIYLTGNTTSTILPQTTGAAEPTNPGGACGYVAAFNPALTQIHQSTFVACGSSYFGISSADFGNGNLYLAGTTQRVSLPGSETGALPTSNGNGDAYIMTMTADLAGPKPTADISVVKEGSERRIENRYVRYWVSISNIGPDDASEVLIEDTLPGEISAAAWQCNGFDGASCPQASGSGSISETAAIPLGGRLEYEICAYVGSNNPVSNTATVSVPSHTLDPDNSNNSDTVIMQDPRIFADSFEDQILPPWCPAI